MKGKASGTKDEKPEEPMIDGEIFQEHVRKRFETFLKFAVSSESSELASGQRTSDASSPRGELIYPFTMRPILNYMTTLAMLKEKSVSITRLSRDLMNIYFDRKDFTVPNSVIFMLPNNPNEVKLAAEIVKNMDEKGTRRPVHFLVTPRRGMLIREILEKIGVNSLVTVHDFFLDLIPIEPDFFSLELKSCFYELNFSMDNSPLHFVAESIRRLQKIYGKIPNVFCKGNHAVAAMEVLKLMESENLGNYDEEEHFIDCLVVLDRSIDLVTPFCTQLTYHGLLDEFFKIRFTKAEVPSSVFPNNSKETQANQQQKPQEKDGMVEVELDDVVFSEIKGQNFDALGKILPKKIEVIQNIIKDKDKRTNDMKEVIRVTQEAKKIKEEYSDLCKHVNILDCIGKTMKNPSFKRVLHLEQSCLLGNKYEPMMSYIETLMSRGKPIEQALRLYLLQNQVTNGLPVKFLDNFRKEIAFSYGFEHLTTLFNLEKAGILKTKESKNHWDSLDKALSLIFPDVNLDFPNDASFAYSGYCPLTVRIVEALFKKTGWKGIQDQLTNKIPGTLSMSENSFNSKKPNTRIRPVVFVYLVGGITRSELIALRYVGEQYGVELYVGTTDIITSGSFLQPFIQPTSSIENYQLATVEA